MGKRLEVAKRASVQHQCKGCGYRIRLSAQDAEFGMLCPECHQRRLQPVRRVRARGGVLTIGLAAEQTIAAGLFCLALGAGTLAWVLTVKAQPKAGFVVAVFGARGVVLVIFGVVCLVAAVGMVARIVIRTRRENEDADRYERGRR